MKIDLDIFEERVNAGLIKKFVHPSGNYIGWTYTDKCQYDRIWDEYIIMARGLVTTTDGDIVSRPFPKFFNLGEPEAEPIPWDEKIEVTEKLDGSLIVVSFHNGNMIVNSKGSFVSEHATFATQWLIDNCLEFVVRSKLLSKDPQPFNKLTFLFEAIFPEKENMKVINYGDKSDLTLLAVIDTESGANYSYVNMCDFGLAFNFPVVQYYMYDDNIISTCKARKIDDGEGLVLHFIPSDKRIKVKSDEYIRLHRLVSGCNPKNVFEMLAKGDDIEKIYERLPDEVYKEVRGWISDYKNEYHTIKLFSKQTVFELKQLKSRSEQAKKIMSDCVLKELYPVLFAMIDDKPYEKAIWDVIKKRRFQKS